MWREFGLPGNLKRKCRVKLKQRLTSTFSQQIHYPFTFLIYDVKVNAISRRILGFGFISALATIAFPALAATTPPIKCRVLGQTTTYKGKLYTCIKAKSKGKTILAWDSGKAIPVTNLLHLHQPQHPQQLLRQQLNRLHLLLIRLTFLLPNLQKFQQIQQSHLPLRIALVIALPISLLEAHMA